MIMASVLAPRRSALLVGNAMHGFTHEGAPPMPGVAPEPLADRRSFATAGSFLAGRLRHHV
ncbi:MAG TPA: hypothetical protein VGG05_11620 [Pseudonocardiaceae bacterium]